MSPHSAQSESSLGEVPPEAEVVHSATRAAEPEPAKEVEVTEVAPAAVAEEKPIVDEPEVPVPEPQREVEEPALVEESVSSPGVTEHEVPAPAVPEPIVEPTAEKQPAPGVPELEHPAPESASGDVPPVEPGSVTEPQEREVVPPAALPEEGHSTDEADPANPEPNEAVQEVPTSDVAQEEPGDIDPSRSPWTPSYSVSSQGGGLDGAAPEDEGAVESVTAPEPPAEEPAAESPPVPEVVTPVEVRASNVSFLSHRIDRFSFRNLSLPNQ